MKWYESQSNRNLSRWFDWQKLPLSSNKDTFSEVSSKEVGLWLEGRQCYIVLFIILWNGFDFDLISDMIMRTCTRNMSVSFKRMNNLIFFKSLNKVGYQVSLFTMSFWIMVEQTTINCILDSILLHQPKIVLLKFSNFAFEWLWCKFTNMYKYVNRLL